MERNKIKPDHVLENPKNKAVAVLINGHKYSKAEDILPNPHIKKSYCAMSGRFGRPTTVGLYYIARYFGPHYEKIQLKTKVAIITEPFEYSRQRRCYIEWSLMAHKQYGYKIELEELKK